MSLDLYYEKNKELVKARAKIWANNNKEKRKLIRKKWRDNNIIKAREIEKASALKRKKQIAEYQRKHRAEKPGWSASLCAKRRALKQQRTPLWLTKSHLKEIQDWYNLAAELQWLYEDQLHVDHIVPLCGKIVSGLHVPWNLQILPRTENCKKSNKW